MKYEILVFDLYSFFFFGTESKAVINKTLLWERSLVFSLLTVSNKSFLLPLFGLIVSSGSTPTKSFQVTYFSMCQLMESLPLYEVGAWLTLLLGSQGTECIKSQGHPAGEWWRWASNLIALIITPHYPFSFSVCHPASPTGDIRRPSSSYFLMSPSP